MLFLTVLELSTILVIFALAYPLAINDIREHRLPNKYTIPALAYSTLALSLAGIVSQDFNRLAFAIVVMLTTLGLGYLLSWLDLLGFGDSKFLANSNLILCWFNPVLAIVALTLGFGIAAIGSLMLLARKRIGFKDSVALGPYLILGFCLTALVPLSDGVSRFTEVAGS
ncbi:MAG: prepilin peptidase [Aquiluna sp.]|nr:prepilin peptidase [Aquiluna sp.]MCF8545366.1 prepilin peptidase [Aquiluna sp.]